MKDLTKAGFIRLQSDILFRVCIGAMFLFGAGAVVFCRLTMQRSGYPIPLDGLFFICPILLTILTAAFCSVFTGTEYSDGTLRNKLVAGHSRTSVYMTQLLTSSCAVLMMLAAYYIALCALGIPLLGFPAASPMALLAVIGLIALLAITFCAVFTALAMCCDNKTTTVIVCLVSFFAFLVLAVYLNSMLQEPEMYDSYTYITNNDEYMSAESTPNPNYISGFARTFVQFLLDFMPTGQALQLTARSTPHPGQMVAYAVLLSVLFTSFGVLFFRKKDIK